MMDIARRLAASLPPGTIENRPQQNQMAQAVADLLQQGGNLMVEAGTGVGKSFAYLLPALDYALKEGGPVVVSTHTLTLQEQLFQRDLPIVVQALQREGLGPVRAVLLKGRGNYLSKRRLGLALEGSDQTDLLGEGDTLYKIQAWAVTSLEGTLSTAPFLISSEVWNEVKSDPFHCRGPQCPTFDTCFYHSTRKKAYQAHLILVNHALLLADLALKMESEQGVLPPYKALIVDEAHHLPALAAEHLATSVSQSECLGLVRRLLFTDEKAPGGKGLFAAIPTAGAGEAVSDFKLGVHEFFGELGKCLEAGAGGIRAARLPDPPPEMSVLARPLARLEALLGDAAETAPSEELEMEAKGTREECRELVRRLSYILERGWGEEACYLVEPDTYAYKKGEIRASSVRAVPLDSSELLKEHLLSSVRSAIFTSATLSVGNDFSYFRHALGLDGEAGEARVTALRVGSPFDFRRQVTMFLPRSMPHPRREEEKYNREVVEYVRASLRQSHGKAFVLFTSFKMMRQVSEAIRGDLDELGITLLVQGEEGWDRTRLLKVFREDIHSVLLGVNSFWEGVDVPGEALSNLIITKLPFQVPEGPLVEARHARMREEGLEPFQVESLPEAVLRLKQGFGRLIRSATDVGTVTLLDPRVTTERWGRVFLDSLPDCERVFLSKPGQVENPYMPSKSPPAKASKRGSKPHSKG